MARILIIDDDSAVCDYLATLVTRLGHQAVKAATCAEGLKRMADPAIEILIADIYLPDSPALDEWVEIVVSDNASTDRTQHVVDAASALYPINYGRNETNVRSRTFRTQWFGPDPGRRHTSSSGIIAESPAGRSIR